MEQLKDKEHTEAIIKISKIREVFKDGAVTSYKDKLICIRIGKLNAHTSTCFPDNQTGHRKLIKFIKEELYIK